MNTDISSPAGGNPASGLLTEDELLRRLYDPSPASRLVVVPLLDPRQIGRGTIDLRLGTDFILSRRIRYAGLDPLEGGDDVQLRLQRFHARLMDYQDRIHIRIGKSITLHPQQFVLGSSLEYIRLPSNLTAYVIGRSSWGRMGLVIATATMVHSTFMGSITLELSNIGDAPITLYPGMRIAQLALHHAGPTAHVVSQAASRYAGLTGPAETAVHDDPDWDQIDRMRISE